MSSLLPTCPGGEGQDERQVEQGVAVDHYEQGHVHPDGPEHQQAEQRVERRGRDRVAGRDEQDPGRRNSASRVSVNPATNG